MNTHLVWFRQDLRITDNPALTAACQDPEANVVAVYIATPEQWQQHDMSPRQAAFILANLKQLQQDLDAIGIPLLYRETALFSSAVEEIGRLCDRLEVSALFYNRQYEWNERQRDRQLEQRLSGSVTCYGFDGGLLLPPLSVLTESNNMYKVFTPFRNAFIRQMLQQDLRVQPAPAKRQSTIVSDKMRGSDRAIVSDSIEPFSYPLRDCSDFPAGEDEARRRLRQFCRERVADYAFQRDLPAMDMTSRLSPYLALGVISSRQCYNRLQMEHPAFWQQADSGAFIWFNELVWREFYQNLLLAHPRLSKHHPFIDWTTYLVWDKSDSNLLAWQQGKTGYPIVDAAMRQLNQTGWMHNRLRMIAASFLVKDLLIDWRLGERYFMSQLVDGDLAANNGGWQWAASTGTDAAPYFRIFNPTTQGKRFDPDGRFIRQWLPELGGVPDKMLHTPHLWLEKQGNIIDYPLPIVDHAQARRITLTAFEQAKRIGNEIADGQDEPFNRGTDNYA